jgi:8-oxo-dGTP diphosphatase
MDLPLKWEFPGGKVEPGEDPKEALAREVLEELNVVIEVSEHLGRGEVESKSRRILLDVYEARVVSGEPHPNEHRALRWCGAQDLPHLDWADADQPLIGPLVIRLARSS